MRTVALEEHALHDAETRCHARGHDKTQPGDKLLPRRERALHVKRVQFHAGIPRFDAPGWHRPHHVLNRFPLFIDDQGAGILRRFAAEQHG